MSNASIPAEEKIEGVVTARPCDCCGHHEIGIVTGSGDYIPLRPGMQVRIIDQPIEPSPRQAAGNLHRKDKKSDFQFAR